MSLGKLFIVSGPTGVGKSTVCARLLSSHSKKLRRIVTATTRAPREGEIDGVDYFFIDETTFLRYIAEDKFLEYANVHKKYYYGTPAEQVLSNLRHGYDSILIIDVQGMMNIRKRLRKWEKNIVTIFMMPEEINVLETRLVHRGSENFRERECRLNSARNEIRMAQHYDYMVLSGTKEEDFLSMEKIYQIECIYRPRVINPMRFVYPYLQNSYVLR